MIESAKTVAALSCAHNINIEETSTPSVAPKTVHFDATLFLMAKDVRRATKDKPHSKYATIPGVDTPIALYVTRPVSILPPNIKANAGP